MFLPIGDDNSFRRTTPFIVYLLIATCCIAWMLQLSGGEQFTLAWSTIPYEITHGTDLIGEQAIQPAAQPLVIDHAQGPSPIWLTVLSAMFLHGSWMHLIGNMLYLYIFGDQIEDELGHGRFLFFYLVCGICASIAYIASAPESVLPSLGASGAIAGVLGAYLVKHPQNRVEVLVYRSIVPMPAIVVLGFWFALQFFGQVGSVEGAGGVAYMAHIGGFIAGVILIFLPPFRGK